MPIGQVTFIHHVICLFITFILAIISFHFAFQVMRSKHSISLIYLFFRHRGTEINEPADLQDLEIRMDSIMTRLRGIENEVSKLKKQGKSSPEKLTVVIEADPNYPPLSIQTLIRLLMARSNLHILVTVHQHSSLEKDCPTSFMQWHESATSNLNRVDNLFNLAWIWKPIGRNPVAKIVNRSGGDICGETAIARLFARLLESCTDCAFYEDFDINTTAQIDEWLDMWESCPQAGDSVVLTKRINNRLGSSDGRKWIAGELPGTKSLADIFLSSLLGHKLNSDWAKEWLLKCNSF